MAIHHSILDQIDREIDLRADPDHNLQHLRHLLEGYRSRILGESDCPYSPGSARGLSWIRGWTIAGVDQRAAEFDKRL